MLPWFALQVRSRHEKMVSQLLHQKGFEEFLPLYLARQRWSDRITKVELPLFPGYVFCRFDAAARLPILMTPGVASIIRTGNELSPVEDGEIEAIRVIVLSGHRAAPYPFLNLGQRVRIEFGSLKGIEGVLVSFKNTHRLVVSVPLLQRSVAVEIDRDWVDPLPSRRGCFPRAVCSSVARQ